MITAVFSADRVWGGFSLNRGESMTGRKLVDTVLTPLLKRLRETHPRGLLPFRLHFDNSPVHKSKLVTAFLRRHKLESLAHPPYSPDLSPCDYFMFGDLKQWLRGKRFADESEAAEKVEKYLTSLDKGKLLRSMQAWPSRCVRVVRSKGAFLRK
jgi:histone-lysine N-methyltransferase SETMAR